MHDFSLLNASFGTCSLEDLQSSMILLGELLNDKRGTENLHHSNDFYQVENINGSIAECLFSKLPNKQFMRNVLPGILQRLRVLQSPINSFEELDQRFPNSIRAFYGVDFAGLIDDDERLVFDKASYNKVKYQFEQLSKQIFWENKESLFSNIEFVKEINDCQGRFYSLPNINPIIDRLKKLEEYSSSCLETDDLPSYKEIKSDLGFDCSPESKPTMQQYFDQRTFTSIDDEKLVFNWHMKIGDTRLYYYIKDYRVIIGYIGKHLPTAKFN